MVVFSNQREKVGKFRYCTIFNKAFAGKVGGACQNWKRFAVPTLHWLRKVQDVRETTLLYLT